MIICLRIESWFWSFNEGMNGITDAHMACRTTFNEGINGITDAHIVWRTTFNEGMNGIIDAHCMADYV